MYKRVWPFKKINDVSTSCLQAQSHLPLWCGLHSGICCASPILSSMTTLLRRPVCRGRDQPQSHSWPWLGQRVALRGSRGDKYNPVLILNSDYWYFTRYIITVRVKRMSHTVGPCKIGDRASSYSCFCCVVILSFPCIKIT